MILIDSDAIIALIYHQDSLHLQAANISKNLTGSEEVLTVAATTASECVTTLRRKLSDPAGAERAVKWLTNGKIFIYPVNGEMFKSAAKIFDPFASKKHTFFDAVNVAVAQKEGIEIIFSFDDFYRDQGLKLAGDLD